MTPLKSKGGPRAGDPPRPMVQKKIPAPTAPGVLKNVLWLVLNFCEPNCLGFLTFTSFFPRIFLLHVLGTSGKSQFSCFFSTFFSWPPSARLFSLQIPCCGFFSGLVSRGVTESVTPLFAESSDSSNKNLLSLGKNNKNAS